MKSSGPLSDSSNSQIGDFLVMTIFDKEQPLQLSIISLTLLISPTPENPAKCTELAYASGLSP